MDAIRIVVLISFESLLVPSQHKQPIYYSSSLCMVGSVGTLPSHVEISPANNMASVTNTCWLNSSLSPADSSGSECHIHGHVAELLHFYSVSLYFLIDVFWNKEYHRQSEACDKCRYGSRGRGWE